jgi:hypothetical protein
MEQELAAACEILEQRRGRSSSSWNLGIEKGVAEHGSERRSRGGAQHRCGRS